MSDHASEYDRADRLLHPDDHVKAENLRVEAAASGGGAVEAAAAVLASHPTPSRCVSGADGAYRLECICGLRLAVRADPWGAHRAHVAEALAAAGLLAAPGRAGGGGREFTADEVIEIANETSDSFGNLYRLDFIDRIRHEAALAADSPADSGAGGGGGG